jgi:inorganic pyrophosphatase
MDKLGFHHVPIGDKAPEVVNAIIEIPKGSHNKYEYDEKLGVFKLDRVLYSPFHYPVDYGFIPETRSEDGDHLDIMVIGSDPVFPGCLVKARPICMMNMIDDGEPDAKIFAVQVDNPRFKNMKTLADLEAWNEHFTKEVTHFFTVLKDLQGKKVEVQGWVGLEEAHAEIKKAQEMYKKESHE